jgi:hypothetical protein
MEIKKNDRVIISAIAELVEEKEQLKKAEKEIFNQKVNELVASGIDRTLAKIMAKSFIDCNC